LGLPKIKMARIYSKNEIQILRACGKRLASVVNALKDRLKAGVRSIEIEELTRSLMAKTGGVPSFLNYEGFPAATCISVNDEVVHCAPTNYRFREGDIVGLDVGLKYKGLHTDMAVTVPVGRVNQKTKKFIGVARRALDEAIEKARPGNKVGDISHAIQKIIERGGYSVVKELSGHGVGKELHEEPTIPNYGRSGEGEILKEGMVLAIEPIINMGSREVETAVDGWKIKTQDQSLSAHFEHTILIGRKKAEILTTVNPKIGIDA
jgi:methionyl aminopeptidase